MTSQIQILRAQLERVRVHIHGCVKCGDCGALDWLGDPAPAPPPTRTTTPHCPNHDDRPPEKGYEHCAECLLA